MAASDVTSFIRVTGRVQGVGYRQWTWLRAGELGLTGWVRNRADGCVEATLSGEAQALAAMIEAMKAGPPGARVVALETREGPPEAFERFEIRPTA